MTKIGYDIKSLRISRNMSQERFGKKLGLSGKTISSYETGRSVPPLKVLEEITKVYNVEFVRFNEDKKEGLYKRLNEIRSALRDIEITLTESLSF